MEFLPTRVRKTFAVGSEAGRIASESERLGLPPHFEAIGEALASGSGITLALSDLGWSLAQDGVSLAEGLEALRSTSRRIVGNDPAYDDIAAFCEGWSESTLSYLHQMSCDDPLTGLATLAHVRSRAGELLRGAQVYGDSQAPAYALVVVEIEHGVLTDPGGLSRSMLLARLGDSARTVFSTAETVGRAGERRIVVLVRRDDRLDRRVALLDKLIEGLELGCTPRVWVEGLPDTEDSAACLLSELARS